MHTKKSFLSAFSSIALIPLVVVIVLIDKPDYVFFNFVYRNIIPAAQIIGQGITYPVRLVGKAVESVRKNKTIVKENADMLKELENMRKIAAENEVLQRENALLKGKLNITEGMKYRTVVSNVVHDNSFSGSQSFITRNPDGEIRVGSVVVSNTGFLLGMITEVSGGYAKIQSVQDSNSNIPVRIAGTDVFGFLRGYGNKDPKLRFLSDGDFAAEEGMFLITSGVKGNVPDGIPVGTVKRSAGGEIAVGLGAEMKRQESVMILLFDADKKYE